MTLLALVHRQFTPVVIAIALAYAVTLAMHEWRRLRAPVDFLGLTMPGIGGLIRQCCVANFCRMYATQTEAGLHPSNVYRDAVDSVGNVAIERRLMAWKHFVDDGEPVSEALRRSHLLSFDVLALIQTSEHTASAGDVLPRIATFITDQVRHQMRAAVRALTPMMPFVIAFAFFGAGIMARFGLGIPSTPISFMDGAVFVIFFLIFLI